MCDRWLSRHRCSVMLSTALSVVYEAAERAREAHMSGIVAQLEDLSEDLIKLHRDVLELPPQSSTALCDVDQVPF